VTTAWQGGGKEIEHGTRQENTDICNEDKKEKGNEAAGSEKMKIR
jgi:hypothetical protein